MNLIIILYNVYVLFSHIMYIGRRGPPSSQSKQSDTRRVKRQRSFQKYVVNNCSLSHLMKDLSSKQRQVFQEKCFLSQVTQPRTAMPPHQETCTQMEGSNIQVRYSTSISFPFFCLSSSFSIFHSHTCTHSLIYANAFLTRENSIYCVSRMYSFRFNMLFYFTCACSRYFFQFSLLVRETQYVYIFFLFFYCESNFCFPSVFTSIINRLWVKGNS